MIWWIWWLVKPARSEVKNQLRDDDPKAHHLPHIPSHGWAAPIPSQLPTYRSGPLGAPESFQSRKWCLHHLKPWRHGIGKYWKTRENIGKYWKYGKRWENLERNHENSELWLVKLQKSQEKKTKNTWETSSAPAFTLGPYDLWLDAVKGNRAIVSRPSCRVGCCGGAVPSLQQGSEILIKLHKCSTGVRIPKEFDDMKLQSPRILMNRLWLWNMWLFWYILYWKSWKNPHWTITATAFLQAALAALKRPKECFFKHRIFHRVSLQIHRSTMGFIRFQIWFNDVSMMFQYWGLLILDDLLYPMLKICGWNMPRPSETPETRAELALKSTWSLHSLHPRGPRTPAMPCIGLRCIGKPPVGFCIHWIHWRTKYHTIFCYSCIHKHSKYVYAISSHHQCMLIPNHIQTVGKT